MKRKGITIWEQHLEHIVLVGALVFFGVFAALQFIRDPNSVDMMPTGKVRPSEIDGLLETTASNLQNRLRPEAAPAFEIPDHAPVLDVFAAQIASSISPERAITPSNRRVVLFDKIETLAEVAYAVPKIGAPFSVVAEQYFDGILAEEVESDEALRAMLPKQPYDLTWITTAARFDLKQVWEQFKPLPVNWYFNRMTVLDVKVEREEFADGVWTARRTLDVLPRQLTVRDRISGIVDRGVRDDVLGYIGEPGAQDAIIRPPFLGTANDSWTAPDPRVQTAAPVSEMTEEQQKLAGLDRQFSRMAAKREDLVRRLEELGGSLSAPTEPPGEPQKPDEREGRGAGGGDQGDRGAGGSKDRRPPPEKRKPGGAGAGTPGFGSNDGGKTDGRDDQEAIERFRKRIESLDKTIAQLARRIADLRGDGVTAEELAARSRANPLGDVLNSDEIVVWAHDISIQPDRRYRYRFTVELYNPFFAHRMDLLEGQHGLAEHITLASAPSEWSEGIRAIPPLKVYVTKAYGPKQSPGQLGMGQATAEVYRFYHGRWWSREFPVQPGDRIGALKASSRDAAASGPDSVDYGTDWFLLDIIEDPDAERMAADRGLGARAMLQHRSDPSETVVMDPRGVANDLERQRLKDLVDLADLPQEVAAR